MIYSVRGTLTHVEMNLAVIECAGVGYAVRTSAYTMSKLPQMGSEVKLYTYLHISEAAADLFGFLDPGELSCFKQLLSVSRVGPKVALSVLSTVTPEQFAFCVASGDAKTIAKAPGLGLKTAQRILLELKDKISKEQLSGSLPETFSPSSASNAGEAISALVVLGYRQSDAAAAVSKLDPDTPVDEMIKFCLRSLAGQ